MISGSASGFLLLFAAYFLSRKYRFNYLYGIVVFLCCFALGAGITEGRLHRTDFPFSDKAEVYQAVIQETPETKERSILCRVRIEGKVGADNLWVEKYNHTALLYLSKDSASTTLKQGDRLWVHARLMPPTNNSNPDEFDYVRYFLRKGGSATAYVPEGHWQVVGYETSRTLRQASLDYRRRVIELYQCLGFQGDNLAILSALTVGDKENLSENILETYSIAGASHVLALSGLHIGFLYALLFFLLSPPMEAVGFLQTFRADYHPPASVGICLFHRIIFFRGTFCHDVYLSNPFLPATGKAFINEHTGGYGFSHVTL